MLLSDPNFMGNQMDVSFLFLLCFPVLGAAASGLAKVSFVIPRKVCLSSVLRAI